MKSMVFQQPLPLREALGILPGVSAVIGSGGKTSLILRLARELAHEGRVVVAASTHMFPPEGIALVTGGLPQIEAALSQAPIVCAGAFVQQGKLGPPEVPFQALAELAPFVLVEADGSRHLPLKAHAAHEPVIPTGAQAYVVVGASGFLRPVREAAHRPELYAAALGVGMDEPVTPEMAAEMIKARFAARAVVVNQVNDEVALALVARFATAYGRGTVVAAALGEELPVKALWRE